MADPASRTDWRRDIDTEKLRRAQRQIRAGKVTIYGHDRYGRPHSCARALGRLDWRIDPESGEQVPINSDTPKLTGPRIEPVWTRWHDAA